MAGNGCDTMIARKHLHFALDILVPRHATRSIFGVLLREAENYECKALHAFFDRLQSPPRILAPGTRKERMRRDTF